MKTFAEIEALRLECVEKGYILPKYPAPYEIEAQSTMGKTFADFSWESGEHPMDKGNPDDLMGGKGQFAYSVGPGFINDFRNKEYQRLTGYTLDKRKAKEWRDNYNFRHFKAILDSKGAIFL